MIIDFDRGIIVHVTHVLAFCYAGFIVYKIGMFHDASEMKPKTFRKEFPMSLIVIPPIVEVS